MTRVADEAELAEACAVLEDVMGEVGERPCPPGALRTACATARAAIAGAEPPFDTMAVAAGLEPEELPDDDVELWLALAAGVVGDAAGPTAELGLLEWLSAVAALTLWGPGTQADPPALALCVSEAAEGEADALILETAFVPVVQRWRALGALEVTERLTPLGWWGLPEAQRRAWGGKPRT
ncbi:MAG: hypothetical protein ACRDZ7_00235 [Acidimicrobiia bacterium]